MAMMPVPMLHPVPPSCSPGGSAEAGVLRQTCARRHSTARTRHSTVAGKANSAVAEQAWLGSNRL